MPSNRVKLTDRGVDALQPAPKGTDRYEVADSIVPGLRVRVTEAGKKTFVLLARYPGSKNPTRRELCPYTKRLKDEEAGALDRARQTARDWLLLLEKGIDPKIHAEELKAKEIERQENTFGDAVEDYIKRVAIGKDEKNPLLRSGPEIARSLRAEFANDYARSDGSKRKGLAKRPISGVTKKDIMTVIDDAINRGSPSMAHTLLAHVRMFFNWAIDSGKYGIESSPCDRIKPKAVIGKKPKRKRVLTDIEIAAVWEATDRMGYPFGPIFKLLLLSGLRLREVASMPYGEFDLKYRMWTIPAARMKKDNDHHVPIGDLMGGVLEDLPTHKDGRFYFTTTAGQKPVSGFSKAKDILDREVLAALKRRATAEGHDPEAVKLTPFVSHDLRRTVRTRLSALGVSKVVSELIIAHTQKDLDAVYDQWAFIDERRDALKRWEMALRGIVMPVPDNVVQLAEKRANVDA
ncbi:tyrosine-type recombinase/integrase [Rhizobium rhizogenes]|uniref:tyrosine-type recombinase/integrase n=1 Tax=Rhizobium rhizogenes TaxID=359 RepID=UPI0024BD9DA9|nr:tyrosine-type recombinase/integrase [Rhizobium rhizogenes]MDJ1633210.1 integrase arm-type DNA-binding domain-containing protein [Rhizobium rhizogenes]